jgi:hypothetical protein
MWGFLFLGCTLQENTTATGYITADDIIKINH